MTDDEFAAAFEACVLPPAAFRHADHVRLAWIYLRRMALPAAMQRYAERLKAFAGHVGKPGLYHETITFAFLMVIGERIADGPEDEDWKAFRARNPDLFQGVKGALGRYYSDARLASPRSRAGFVMPDRLVG
jgi:N-formylglutamate deformylase